MPPIRTSRWALLGNAALLCATIFIDGCDNGALHLRLHAAPSPDDKMLSPLTDPNVFALELRDAKSDQLIARTRFDRTPSDVDPHAEASVTHLDFGLVEPFGQRDLKLLALSGAGQVLGQALARNASWGFGETVDLTLEVRRPLFLIGGGPQLKSVLSPSNAALLPNRQLVLEDGRLLRLFDSNSIEPFLSSYDRMLDATGTPPNANGASISAVGSTHDGRWVLTITDKFNLHGIETLQFTDQLNLPLNSGGLTAREIIVAPNDQSAIVLFYSIPVPKIGLIGKLLFITDLASLLTGGSGNFEYVDIDANAAAGPPIAAAYAPDGTIEVLFGSPPLDDGQPDCASLAGADKSELRRYDPSTRIVTSNVPLPYSTGLAYTGASERIVVQPCSMASNGIRPGRVEIQGADTTTELFAPGSVQAIATGASVSVIGRDNSPNDPALAARGAVRRLDPGATKWSSSLFDLSPWTIPYRITVTNDGRPYSSSIDIAVAPNDLLVYRIVPTLDRNRAVAFARTQHKINNLFLNSSGNGNQTVKCFVDFDAYQYHIMLINMQSGFPEIDAIVGIKNKSCSSRSLDVNNNSTGACFTPCDLASTEPYLINFADGYIPTGVDVVFGQ